MQIALHAGAHATDEDRLITCLRRNQARMARSGVGVPPPSSYRKLLRDILNSAEGTGLAGDARDMVLDAIGDTGGVDRLILSNQGFFGTQKMAVSGSVFYPAAEARLGLLQQLFAGDEIALFLGIRNPAMFLPALLETLNIAAVATILGGLFAMILAFLGTSNLDVWPPLVPVARRAMDIMRAFPELIIALFLIFVLGTSPVPAMIAVAFHTAGALGKQFSEVNENIDRRPIEGLQAVGAGWLQRMKFAVIPQVLPNYLSYFMLRFEVNVRASAILGFVGAGGIGSELRRTIGWGQGAGDETAALFLLLILTIIAIDQLSSYVRRRIIQA